MVAPRPPGGRGTPTHTTNRHDLSTRSKSTTKRTGTQPSHHPPRPPDHDTTATIPTHPHAHHKPTDTRPTPAPDNPRGAAATPDTDRTRPDTHKKNRR
ncbi:hypothetical protein OG828_01380 [Streptomyces sp. NBC_00457]|uniref:hypothetical protein n=1 Tax=Streptomyces sp. NBC_00457 TaxID=2975748 RepID=UPI002E251C8A